MVQSIYQKYRPKKFSQITGQKYVVKILASSIANNRIGSAYLFTGSHGTGKTTLARIFAKTINCLNPVIKNNQSIRTEPCDQCANCKLISSNQTLDLIEIDAASHTGVDNIRQLKENVFTPPMTLKYKIYIIDEVHMLSIGAFNALLKILEEPPTHAIFILATTEIHKVPDTIISRCQRFDFQKLSQTEIIERLRQLAEKEGVKIEKEALENIAIESEGGMRDAESLLGQIIAFEDKNITAKEVCQIVGLSSKKTALEFIDYLFSQKVKKSLEIINRLQNEGVNLKNFNKVVLGLLRNILLNKALNDEKQLNLNLSPEQKKIIKNISLENSYEDILLAVKLFQKNIFLFKNTSILQLPLEMATIEFYLKTENKKTINKPAEKESMIKNQITEKEKAPHLDKFKKDIGEKESPNLSELKIDPAEKSTTSKINIEKILDNWSQIIKEIKPFNHSIHAFLKNCVPVGIREDNLFIKTKYDFYKAKLNENNNRLTIKRVVDKIAKCNLKICFCDEKEAKNLDVDNKLKSQNHNPLHDAMQMMGGRIVE